MSRRLDVQQVYFGDVTRQILPSPLAPAKALPYRVIEIPRRRTGRGNKLVEVEDALADLYFRGYRIIGCGEWYVVLEFQQSD